MGRHRKVNTCPITGDVIMNRKGDATFSIEGKKVHRQQYMKEYRQKYWIAAKVVSIGLIIGVDNTGEKETCKQEF